MCPLNTSHILSVRSETSTHQGVLWILILALSSMYSRIFYCAPSLYKYPASVLGIMYSMKLASLPIQEQDQTPQMSQPMEDSGVALA